MKFFLALAATVVLAQGADAATKTTDARKAKKPVAAKSMKKKSKKQLKGSSSSATQSASSLDLASAVNASSVSQPAATSTAKASTSVDSIASRIGMDWYTYAESNIRETNTDGGVISTSGSFVGLNYKLSDSAKVYIRQQYGFAVPGTGAGDKKVDELEMKAEDLYLRYQNSNFLTFGNEIKLGGRATLTLPTGEGTRTKADSAHNGLLSVRGTLSQQINKVFSWDYLAQVGYNNMANKGTFNTDRSLVAGTTQYAFSHVAGLNADVLGLTFTQNLGQKAKWKHETEDVGVEQTNVVNLTTSVSKSVGPLYMAIGVSQDQSIMSDAAADKKFSVDKIYDDKSTAYYLEMQVSI